MKKIQKLAVVSVMAIAMTVSNDVMTIQASATNLEQEISIQRYQIPVSLWHATKDQESMANSAICSQAILEVSEDKTKVYIYTEAMTMAGITANLQHLYIKSADGSSVEAQIESYNEDGTVECFSFEVDLLEEYVDVTVDAGIMAADARLKFNLDEITEETEADKIYEAQINIWHATQNQASMMDVCVDSTARVVVRDGKYHVYIYTSVLTIGNISGYVTGLQVMDANGEVSVATIEKQDETGIATCFSFELSELQEYYDAVVNAEVPIPGMSEMNIRIKFDMESLTEVSEVIDVTVGKQEVEGEDLPEDSSGNTGEEVTEEEPTVDGVTSATTNESSSSNQSGITNEGGLANQGGTTNQGDSTNKNESSASSDTSTKEDETMNSSDSNQNTNTSGTKQDSPVIPQTQSVVTETVTETLEGEEVTEEESVVEVDTESNEIEDEEIETEELEVEEIKAEQTEVEEEIAVSTESQQEDTLSPSSVLVRATAGVSTMLLAGLYIFDWITDKKKQNKGKK